MSEKDIWLRFGNNTHAWKLSVHEISVGSFSNDDGDGDSNENVKKALGLLSKTTSLHVHHTFLYISLPLLHNYHVKMRLVSHFMEDLNKRQQTFLSLSKLECSPKEINSREIGLH